MTTKANSLSKLSLPLGEVRSRLVALRASAPGALRHLARSETKWLWVLLPVIVLVVYVYNLNWAVWGGPSKILLFQPYIPIGSALVVYFQRFEISEIYSELVFVYPEDSPKRRGKIWVAIVGCLFLVAAAFSSLATLAIVGFIILIIGGIYYLYGPVITKALWRPLVFLLLMIPPPISYLLQISGHLQSGTAFVAGQVLHLIFHDAQAMGSVVSLPGFLLEVSPGSGGLGILLPVLCLVLVFIMFRQMTVNVAVIVLFIAAVISLFMNIVRIIAIGLVGGINVDFANAWLGGPPVFMTILALYLTYVATNAILRPQRRLSDFEQDLLLAAQYADSESEAEE